jgi:hypothetical protein
VSSFIAGYPQGGITSCPYAHEDWVDIGAPSAGRPTTVANGEQTAGALVIVECSVVASGNGFDVILKAGRSGQGSVAISSPPGAGEVTPTGGGAHITARFESATLDTYLSSDCSITWTYNGAFVPAAPPVAPGRIWGHLSCPNAISISLMTSLPDGATIHDTCDTEADFLFENCWQ